jgi:putative membrane-bound dehydrogenase-like protein
MTIEVFSMRLMLLGALLLCAPVAVAQDRALPPEEAAATMKLPPGFKATLFAGEPAIVQPMAFTFDDRGRVWVVENLSYPTWKADGTGNDRVSILEDTDGDGRHDKRTVFLDNGVNLSGIEVGFGGVWLTSTPNFIFIPDANGDDKPDGPAKILLDGFTLECKHNVVGNLAWGPDGWLYGCHGITAPSLVGKPGTPKEQRQVVHCGVWRFHPVRHEWEVYANGTTNPWGLDWDERGELFITNCVIKHIFHVIPGGHYVRMFGQDPNPHIYGLMESCADHQHWAGGHWTTSRGGDSSRIAAQTPSFTRLRALAPSASRERGSSPQGLQLRCEAKTLVRGASRAKVRDDPDVKEPRPQASASSVGVERSIRGRNCARPRARPSLRTSTAEDPLS